MTASLLYVSRRCPHYQQDEAVLQAIERSALTHNGALGVTGMLVATPRHFVQFLEGEAAAIDTLMSTIRADPRHVEIVVPDTPWFGRRLFPWWRLACFGPANFMNRHLGSMVRRHPEPLSRTETRAVVAAMTDLLAGSLGAATPIMRSH